MECLCKLIPVVELSYNSMSSQFKARWRSAMLPTHQTCIFKDQMPENSPHKCALRVKKIEVKHGGG